ncbi:hypothetical protein EV356DRAFT_232738 [Viridothelium virens]|uniref:Uncharacterized protein n=1 Tax=Viridothelium virens TaxID=1048519 RepID=A0A6A6H4T5_VIRVR|nr:hypothetical protein EV356DRAFT_232738 [Viridothelium virens]
MVCGLTCGIGETSRSDVQTYGAGGILFFHYILMTRFHFRPVREGHPILFLWEETRKRRRR